MDNGWRQRVVERVVPLSADHYEIRRSLQLEIPYQLEGLETIGDKVPLVLPVCWLAKRPMLDFDITDDAGVSVAVMPRREIAGVVGKTLQGASVLAAHPMPLGTLVAIAASSLGAWEQMTKATNRPVDDVAIDFVKAGTGIGLRPGESKRLLEEGREVTLAAYEKAGLAGLWAELYPDNPAFNGLILATYADPTVESRQGLVEWIADHHRTSVSLVEGVDPAGDGAADLRLLCVAGARWPVMIRRLCEPGEIVLIKTREVRSSGHPRVRRFMHEAQTDIAKSYHIQVHSPDPTIVIRGDIAATSGPAQKVGFPQTFEGSRQTRELFTAYLSDPDRPDTVQFDIRFGLRTHVWMGYAFALLLAAGSLAGLIMVRKLTSELAAVLAVPTSVVAAFVVSREPTLTARYLDPHRWLLIALNVLVWVLTVYRLVWASAEGV